MTGNPILLEKTIAVVDDHSLVREGINAMLVQNGLRNIDNYDSSMGLVERRRYRQNPHHVHGCA